MRHSVRFVAGLTEENATGVVTLDGEGGSLLDLEPDRVRTLFAASGALWFRRFQVTAEDFLGFIKQFSSELIQLNTLERVKMKAAPEIQSVTGGLEALNYHTEMGHVPGRPEFLTFWCQVPSKEGGETLLADGIALWEALSDGSQRKFLDRRILYDMVVPWEWWTHRFRTQNGAFAARKLGELPGVRAEVLPDDSLQILWVTEAAFRPHFSERLCFASNLFENVVPGLKVTFEDGTAIDQGLIDDLTEAADRVAVPITWSPSDVVLFDNTRWLHGRRAPLGIRRRRVQMLQGYLNFGGAWQKRLGRIWIAE